MLGDVTISSYNLQLIPIAEDVVSLEHDTAFKEIWVVSLVEFERPCNTHFGGRMATRRSYTTPCKPSYRSKGSLGFSRE